MSQSRTGAGDEVYDLVSILYHALQGAHTYDKYIQDAGSNQQLASFFRDVQQQDRQRAQQAQEQLRRLLGQQGGSQSQSTSASTTSTH